MATQVSDATKLRSRATAADDLSVIVQRAQAFTNASGAAIAVSEGNSDEIVCRARSGASAPDVGTALRVEGTFTGICIQSGKELRCDDAETDTRVDTAAIRALGIRSMVVTPIKEEGKVVGVLAVFAPTPHAFTITHVAVLKTMADQISTLLHKERRAKEEGHLEPPLPMPKPAAPSVAPQPPVVMKPAGSSNGNGTAAAPARAFPAVAKVEPIRPVPVAADIAPAVPAPKKEREQKRTEFKPFDYKTPEVKPESVPSPKAGFGTLEAVAGEKKSAGPNKLILIGVVVAVLAVAGAVFGFMKMGKSRSSASSSQPAQQPATQPVTTAAASTPAPATSAPPQPTTVTPSNSKPEKTESRKGESESKRSEPKNESPSKPAPATVTLAGNTGSKIAAASAAAPAQTQDVTPSFGLGGGSASALNSLAAPVTSVKPAMVAQSNLVNARAIRMVPAVYPEIAKSRHLSGTVVVKVTIGKDGKVSNPTLVSGSTIFRDAAFNAVVQWLFQPATLNGQPTEQDTLITVKFSPS
jgi:TonB family protein